MSTSNDGSESVDQFLARIASLKEGRDEESEARTRRMEEDFQKSRKERQARRLERARSLSPSKTGPARANSILSSPTPIREKALNPPVDFSPRTPTLSRSNAVRTSPILEPKDQSNSLPPSPAPILSPPAIINTLSRSGTLSWQQRPSPRDGTPNRPRPLSTISTVRRMSSDGQRSVQTEQEPTREEIAASLASRDPAWFRQTHERGAGSAAYRKNQVEDTPSIESGFRSMRLPGLSSEAPQAIKPAQDQSMETPTRARPLPARPTSSAAALISGSGPVSPEAQSGQVSVSPSQPPESRADTPTGRPESALSSAVRSPSPTKGLGGFVQSAMMKRSDSINKRWSVQATGGLKRGDSVAGARPLSALGPMHAPKLSRDVQNSHRDASSSPVASRPGSSHGVTRAPVKSSSPEPLTLPTEPPVEDAATSTKTVDKDSERPETSSTDLQLNRSSSKTLDSRRWSPTKSSWLESTLLSKPEPPTITPKTEDQPRWKVDLQRSRSIKDLSPNKDAKSTKDASIKPSETSVTAHSSTQPPEPEPPTTIPESEQRKVLFRDKQKPTDDAKLWNVEQPVDSKKSTKVVQPDTSKKHGTHHDTSKELVSQAPAQASPISKLDKKPPTLRPKPQTPPKTDFRASLRPRTTPATDGNEAEPEFKAMFGKLKSAQTKNYVAPDVLKKNITSGKAALNVTDGPQKSKRVDEFKESILQKKEAMKVTTESKKQEPVSKKDTSKSEAPLPEALARRKTLHKATPSVTKLQDSSTDREADLELKPRPLVPQKNGNVGVKPVSLDSPVALASPPLQNLRSLPPSKSSEKKEVRECTVDKEPSKPPVLQTPLAEKDLYELPKKSMLEQGPTRSSTPQAKANTDSAGSKQETLLNETKSERAVALSTANLPTTEKPAAGLPPASKLASRLNPNLATLISRSGSPRPSASSSPSSEAVPQVGAIKSPDHAEEAGGELTHATKGRAKGPKRRAPKAQTTLSKSITPSSAAEAPATAEKLPKEAVQTRSVPRIAPTTTVKPFTRPGDGAEAVQDISDDSKKEDSSKDLLQPKFVTSSITTKPRPVVVAKSPELRRVSSNLQQTEEQSPSKPSLPKKFDIVADKAAPTSSPQTTTAHRFPSPKPAPLTKPLTPNKSRVNTAKQSRVVEAPSEKTSISEISIGPSASKKPDTSRTVTSVPARQPKLPQEASSMVGKEPSAPSTSDAAAVSQILDAYFSEKPRAVEKAEFDTSALLEAAKEQATKLKILSKSVWEVKGGGKKSSLPAQQEHILYEDSMYLVSYTSETSPGNKTSAVYLWCGDQVSDGAIDDAQLFCKKHAREQNAKLEVVKQGKEPAPFYQALGDIMIVRRNKSSALYMLCGRRHMGCMAFDEVDFSAEDLCSGFSYLISAKFGKLYLWKGKGSAADEVGCARLIGMDIGLTGEIEEVEEGAETDFFWEAFSAPSSKRVWAREWQQRAEHNTYPPALYRVEHDRPKSAGGFWGLRSASPEKTLPKANVELLEPFCHHDMDPTNVYILDTYRSIYVLLDPKASAKKAEFTTAMHVAQEISMLSPSVQGRTLMPTCYVSFGEPPADVKACFRKWPTEKKQATNSSKPSACVRLEDVMQALGF